MILASTAVFIDHSRIFIATASMLQWTGCSTHRAMHGATPGTRGIHRIWQCWWRCISIWAAASTALGPGDVCLGSGPRRTDRQLKENENPGPRWLSASGAGSHSYWRAGRGRNDSHLTRRLDRHIVSPPSPKSPEGVVWPELECEISTAYGISYGSSNEGTTLRHLRQTHCSICLRDLVCYQIWHWQNWRVRPVVFEAPLWSSIVRSYNQRGDSAPHLSATID